MKHVNVTFEEEDYNNLIKVKDGLSWHDFILKLIQQGGSNDKESNS